MKTKEVRGITIISLVVTIVVLLILAGVSVSLVIGNNNLFDKAKSTQKVQTIAGIKEALELEKADIQVESKTVNLENYLEQISTGKKNYDLSSTEKIDNKNAYIIINAYPIIPGVIKRTSYMHNVIINIAIITKYIFVFDTSLSKIFLLLLLDINFSLFFIISQYLFYSFLGLLSN